MICGTGTSGMIWYKIGFSGENADLLRQEMMEAKEINTK